MLAINVKNFEESSMEKINKQIWSIKVNQRIQLEYWLCTPKQNDIEHFLKEVINLHCKKNCLD